MMLMDILKNKKGDMPWWLVRLLIVLAILLFSLSVIYAVKKGMFSSIGNIFDRW
ncbi:MAG: hypothetical protein U9O94_03730 [Nanoarchaeota archaeon]|nr:hypothetical protein [Nanoarchaeota archaeon]